MKLSDVMAQNPFISSHYFSHMVLRLAEQWAPWNLQGLGDRQPGLLRRLGLPCLRSAFAVLPGFKVLLRGSSRAGCFINHIHYSSYVRGVKSESFHEHLPIVFVPASLFIINSSSIVLVEIYLFYFFSEWSELAWEFCWRQSYCTLKMLVLYCIDLVVFIPSWDCSCTPSNYSWSFNFFCSWFFPIC